METTNRITEHLKENISNFNRYYLKAREKSLRLEGGFNQILILKLENDLWKIEFTLLCFDLEYNECMGGMIFCIELNTVELQYMFGLKDIPGKQKDQKMIIHSYFLRFKDYLGVFLKRNHKEFFLGASIFLTKEIKDVVKKLIKL